jgi:PAS domain S-box-containing protein
VTRKKLAVLVEQQEAATPEVERVLERLPFYAMLIDSQHHVVYANEAVTRDLAIEPHDIVGKYCPQAVHCMDRPYPGCPLEAAVESGESEEREFFDEKTGRWLRSAIHPTRARTPDGLQIFLHFIEDISDKKRAQHERDDVLRTEQILGELLRIGLQPITLDEQLARMLDRVLSVSWMRIMPRGAVFLVGGDDAALELRVSRGLGVEQQEGCAHVPFGKCLCGRAAQGHEVCFASGVDDRHEYHYPGMTPHGHYCLPIRSDDLLLGVLCLYLAPGHQRDAREERFLQAAADVMAGVVRHEKLEGRLRQSQKMEALGRLAAGVAHDFNNILSVVASGGERLQRKLGPDHALYPDAARMARAGQRAEALVRQLLSFARAEPEVGEVVELGSVVAETAIMLRQLLVGRPITLAVEAATEGLCVSVSRVHVEQVLLNLVVNARDAMPDGGHVTIKLGGLSVADQPVHDLTPGAYATLTVSDTGKGMSSEVIDRIFEPFFTTKASDGRSGLGLAVVYGIVQQAGGKISLASRPGQGTTFHVYLPRAGEGRQQAT